MIFQMVRQKEDEAVHKVIAEGKMTPARNGFSFQADVLFHPGAMNEARFEFWFLPEENEEESFPELAFSPCPETFPDLLLGRVMVGDNEYFASLSVVHSGLAVRYEAKGRVVVIG